MKLRFNLSREKSTLVRVLCQSGEKTSQRDLWDCLQILDWIRAATLSGRRELQNGAMIVNAKLNRIFTILSRDSDCSEGSTR